MPGAAEAAKAAELTRNESGISVRDRMDNMFGSFAERSASLHPGRSAHGWVDNCHEARAVRFGTRSIANVLALLNLPMPVSFPRDF